MIVKNKKFSVIGMGKTGIETANFLARKGALTTLLDRRSFEETGSVSKRLNASVVTLWGTEELPVGSQCVVVSPGVDIEAPFLDNARREGIPVISEIELASRFNRSPIIAITGSNGKSTTTRLVEKMLDADGKKIRVGGNIGMPFISLTEEADLLDYMILEVSSFQLEGIKEFRPVIAAILNLSPDHLDRHKTFGRYAAVKARIAMNQTAENYLILNADDSETARLAEGLPVQRIFFSGKSEVEFGSWVDNGIIRARVYGRQFDIGSIESLSRTLRWQVENVLAATTVAALVGIRRSAIMEAVRGFEGLEHRLEWVRSVGNVEYINDSKGTNLGSVVKSLNSFNRPVVLIFGGRDKGGDFQPLLPIFKEKVKWLILIGESRSMVKKLLSGTPPFEEAETLERAVRRATEIAESGDIVLLSPGCASFDMFKDYADRGNRFKALVGKIF
tara:strand:+ start:176 stop:1516 length:1341 start_codon:yes stop_codon:yes gene_type:complete